MPKIFKDPSRHFKSSDHQNKPHITLVNGMPFKNLANYIYNGIKEINDEAIVRSANQMGYSIIYFTNPKKSIESTIFKNKEEVKTGRAKLKLVIAGLIINAEKDTNLKSNSKIAVALTSLRNLAFDFDHDIKAGDLKIPLQKILNEITTPKEEQRKKLTSPHRFIRLHGRGIDRQALSRFNKMDEVELNNLMNLIFPSNNINPLDRGALVAHYDSSKNSIQSMQKFINIYIHLRTTTTSNLVRIAEAMGDVQDIKIFCQAWAKTRRDLPGNAYIKSKCEIHAWASQMDVIVAVLNRRLFQMQSANTPYTNIFSAKLNGAEKNIYSSPISPAGSFADDSVRSPTDDLSPGYLAEDSADRKLLAIINKATPKNTDSIKRTINFYTPPSQVPNQGQTFIGSDNNELTNPRLMSSPTTLTPSVIERLQSGSVSLSDDLYFSVLSPINSPSTFPQRQQSPALSNRQPIGDEEFNHLLAQLSMNPNISEKFNNGENENIEDNLNSEEVDFLAVTNYGNPEHTPEKPDSYRPQTNQNTMQSALKKLSGNLTYQPMPTQQVSNTNPNPSTTNSINNSINNRN